MLGGGHGVCGGSRHVLGGGGHGVLGHGMVGQSALGHGVLGHGVLGTERTGRGRSNGAVNSSECVNVYTAQQTHHCVIAHH